MSISYCVEVNVQLASRDKLVANFLLLLPTVMSRLACTHLYYSTEYLLTLSPRPMFFCLRWDLSANFPFQKYKIGLQNMLNGSQSSSNYIKQPVIPSPQQSLCLVPSTYTTREPRN